MQRLSLIAIHSVTFLLVESIPPTVEIASGSPQHEFTISTASDSTNGQKLVWSASNKARLRSSCKLFFPDSQPKLRENVARIRISEAREALEMM
ncbi:hypothetical protein Tsubulata_015666 [Turnera subulata]|uniref:Uncharacterized protein n=1 Tax=Turnera subulata TaxID=218843 RepID=A0A9Q0FWH9_9ROSI|nr:hypothetical protein Tsubulata_015666 [Turnera subulata]